MALTTFGMSSSGVISRMRRFSNSSLCIAIVRDGGLIDLEDPEGSRVENVQGKGVAFEEVPVAGPHRFFPSMTRIPSGEDSIRVFRRRFSSLSLLFVFSRASILSSRTRVLCCSSEHTGFGTIGPLPKGSVRRYGGVFRTPKNCLAGFLDLSGDQCRRPEEMFAQEISRRC